MGDYTVDPLRLLNLLILSVSTDLRRPRTDTQPGSQSQNQNQNQNQSQDQSWTQQGHRGPQDNQGDPPPAKRLKHSPETQQQPVNPNPKPPHTQPPNPSPQNTHHPSPSSRFLHHLPSPPLSHLQARLGGSGGGSRWSLRQALGRRSLARRILGKERLANRLRQRVLSSRGEESELLTYQENTEDLQVGGV